MEGARAFSVTEITRQIKLQLEERFPAVAVEGELSNVRPSSTGHLYFTLKDDDAAISAVLFRGRTGGLSFVPEDGQQVVVYGSIGVYAKRGTYQIIAERIELAGVGRILAMLEERKRRLAALGIFDEERKRRLPMIPRTVAVVTSPTGAALRDIMQVLGRRNAGVDVVICPTPVQGDQAAEQIARMIRIADRHKLGDVIIVARGGGSLEDLLPFSEEAVAMAIAGSETPVISAVGHEIDWALCDFAADYRAPTPSAAAEVVAASRDELAARVLELGRSIVSRFVERYRRASMLTRQFSASELHRSYWMLAQPTLQEFDRLREDVADAIEERLTALRHRYELSARELVSVSPERVINRGYALARDVRGRVITSVERLEPGTHIDVELRDGTASSTVDAVRRKDQQNEHAEL